MRVFRTGDRVLVRELGDKGAVVHAILANNPFEIGVIVDQPFRGHDLSAHGDEFIIPERTGWWVHPNDIKLELPSENQSEMNEYAEQVYGDDAEETDYYDTDYEDDEGDTHHCSCDSCRRARGEYVPELVTEIMREGSI